MEKESKIYIAGHSGLVGSALIRKLKSEGFNNIITSSHSELDLINQNQVENFFQKEKPEYVFLSAAKVGGIIANNTYRGEFIYNNLMIQTNIIHQSYLSGVKKLMFLGSSCIYPRACPQPIKEEYFMTGDLEYTNEPYAIAKIAGMKMCESYNLQYGTNFIMVMPTNLYGPNDSYDFEKSHVLPAVIRKIYLSKLFMESNYERITKNLGINSIEDSKIILRNIGINENSIKLWGTGTPRREFLHSDDMADACVYIMKNVDFKDLIKDLKESGKEIKNTHINIGSGNDVSIKELSEIVKKVTGYRGEILFDPSKPDGMKQKLLDVSKLESYGWKQKYTLEKGIKTVFENYLNSF